MKLHFLYSRNTSMMRWHKYSEVVFLMFRNANKHVLLAIGVNHTDEGEIYWGSIYAPPTTYTLWGNMDGTIGLVSLYSLPLKFVNHCLILT